MSAIRRMAALRTPEDFRTHCSELGIEIPLEEVLESGAGSPLAQPLLGPGFDVGNRFCVLPMEGWDATLEGKPSDLTMRRWKRFGASGAKLIWGGEAVAVARDGLDNPNQLLMSEANLSSIETLRVELVREHESRFGDSKGLLVGLQLTHSGRYSRPESHFIRTPMIAYRHPILDARLGLSLDYPVLSDDQIAQVRDAFVESARLSFKAGFTFVDIKNCHAYLAHELLSAVDRPGRYGGGFENRTRFLREIIDGVKSEAPGLIMGVRLNAADWIPFKKGPDGRGAPEVWPLNDDVGLSTSYPYAFGGDGTGLGVNLDEPKRVLDLLAEAGIRLVCVTLGSPYYNPHFLRPALFPPTDAYLPPEDPLVGVARHITITAELKRHRPEMVVVGSGYSYLQEWLPHVAQAAVRAGMVDSVGLGRMVLSYPELPADVLLGKLLDRKRVCRTFSDCTSAPRNGIVSGCYPLDPHYKTSEQDALLSRIKDDYKAGRIDPSLQPTTRKQ